MSSGSNPAVDYGYGDAAPDVASNNSKGDVFYEANQGSIGGLPDAALTSWGALGTAAATKAPAADAAAADYGYGAGSPDVGKKGTANPAEVADLYGYGSGSPSRKENEDISIAPLAPDSYEHYRTATADPFTYDGRRVPRRSSLKSSNSYHGTSNSGGNRSLRRRTNSDHGLNVPKAGPQNGSGDGTFERKPPPRRNSAIQVRMRGEPRPVQRRRSIDFAKKVHVKEVEPVAQLTENIRDLWLQADDFDAMKQHRRQLLVQYKMKKEQASTGWDGDDGDKCAPNLAAPMLTSIRHTHEKNDDHSFRGLERYIDKSGRRTKNVAWDTVLLEQDEQECSGYFDEGRIAELYKYSTSESPEKAFARAKQDREA
ncbi:MAG: hypothetical protein SGARI_001012, partial [Bacillariaceae sp.]